ncbi:hypothetical protein DXG01_013439 [Tephrocybe rancida]|nr:hypothetical protein DXG01_013439 [Tephrocybe rancida]
MENVDDGLVGGVALDSSSLDEPNNRLENGLDDMLDDDCSDGLGDDRFQNPSIGRWEEDKEHDWGINIVDPNGFFGEEENVTSDGNYSTAVPFTEL